MKNTITTGRHTLAFIMICSMAIQAFVRYPSQLVSANEVTIQDRPFEMLIFGDSVIWGQGLNDEEKFSRVVKKKLEAKYLGRVVNLEDLSHSGATIVASKKFKVPDDAFEDLHGEVPRPTPTLWAQLEAARKKYDCHQKIRNKHLYECSKPVDLILMNGGINDVGIQSLVNPFYCDWTIAWFTKRRIRKYCHHEMQKFLKAVSDTFGDATVVVAGYYPIICPGTKMDRIKELISSYLSPRDSNWPDETSRDLEKLEWEKRKRKVENPKESWLVKRLSKISNIWKTTSDEALEQSVKEVNSQTGSSKAVFVKVDFGPNECYAGSETKLWEISGFTPGQGLESNDLKGAVRAVACPESRRKMATANIDPFFRLMLNSICPPAGSGHPNIAGSQKYSDAVWNRVEPLLQ